MMPSSSSFPWVNGANTSGLLAFEASGGAGGWTPLSWSALSAVVAALGITLVVVFRRRDARTRRLEPGYTAAGRALVVLDGLTDVCTVNGVTPELPQLRQLVSMLTVAEARSPKVPFGIIVAELKNYLACALPPDAGAQIAANITLVDRYLTLAVAQGMKLEAARAAIITVQRKIEKLTRR